MDDKEKNEVCEYCGEPATERQDDVYMCDKHFTEAQDEFATKIDLETKGD